MLCLRAAMGTSYPHDGNIKPDFEGANIAFTNAPDGAVMNLPNRLQAATAVVLTIVDRLKQDDERIGRDLIVALDLKAFPEQGKRIRIHGSAVVGFVWVLANANLTDFTAVLIFHA